MHTDRSRHEDCKANCCNDATCTVWQFAQYPMGHQAQCMWGDSADYGDSGGIQFQGEQGRGDDPDPSHPGGGSHKHHKCIGVHCDDGGALRPRAGEPGLLPERPLDGRLLPR